MLKTLKYFSILEVNIPTLFLMCPSWLQKLAYCLERMYILTTDSKTCITVGNYSLVTIILVPTIGRPLLIKNWHHRPIHRDEASKENCKYFGIAVMFVWKMQLFNTYISSTPKGPVALEIKFSKWKFGPTCPLKSQLSLTTIESPNIHS